MKLVFRHPPIFHRMPCLFSLSQSDFYIFRVFSGVLPLFWYQNHSNEPCSSWDKLRNDSKKHFAASGFRGAASGRRLECECGQLDVAVLQFILSAVFPLLLPRGLRPAHRPQRGLHQVGTFPVIAHWCQQLIPAAWMLPPSLRPSLSINQILLGYWKQ